MIFASFPYWFWQAAVIENTTFLYLFAVNFFQYVLLFVYDWIECLCERSSFILLTSALCTRHRSSIFFASIFQVSYTQAIFNLSLCLLSNISPLASHTLLHTGSQAFKLKHFHNVIRLSNCLNKDQVSRKGFADSWLLIHVF